MNFRILQSSGVDVEVSGTTASSGDEEMCEGIDCSVSYKSCPKEKPPEMVLTVVEDITPFSVVQETETLVLYR